METETETQVSESKTGSTLYGKVIGVMERRDQIQPLCDELSTLGVREVEVLEGETGIKRMESSLDAVSQFFFGDMESKMVQRYLDAVKQGMIVFVAQVVPETADQAGETAKGRGAMNVVHFGNSVVTNY